MGKHFPFILGFFLLLIAIWLQIKSIGPMGHFIGRLENLAYDLELRTHFFTHSDIKNSTIAIIDIDDKSLSREGRWPWPRAKIANLIEHLQKAGTVVVAFDVIFPEKQNNIAEDVLAEFHKQNLSTPEIEPLFKKIFPAFDDDGKFAKSIANIDVVLGISFLPTPEKQGFLPPALLELTSPNEKKLGFISAPGYIGNISTLLPTAKGGGFINVFPDDDGIIRRVPILIRYENKLYPSLALEAVRLYLLSNIKLITENYSGLLRLENVQLGDHIIPTDAGAQVIVPFRGKSFTFPYYSATDVLHDTISKDALAGKIVFVGTSATGLGDLKATAIQNIYPGVEVQATIADGILTNNFSYRPAWSKGAEVFLTIALGLIFIFLFPHRGPRFLSAFVVGIPIVLMLTNGYLWEKTGLIISIFVPMSFSIILAIFNIIYGYLFESRKREKLKDMFGQYVPEKHIDAMLASTGEYGLYGDDREMTVLFADIRNFTTISEPLSAMQLKQMLNEFFTPMTEIIFKYRGTIDKYVGDMIMAFWGAPLSDKRHAQHAICAALDMQEAVEKLHPVFAAKGWAEINIGIGLNSGIMSVGDMGSKFRRNYTVIGDSVNLASRVESLTKFYGAKIMVSEFTRANFKLFVFRKLDRVRVKGKKHGIEIYEVLGYTKQISAEVKKNLDVYHTALDYYFSKRWDEANALFSELNKAEPDTKIYKLYLKRITEFKENPPPVDWDGIYTHTDK